MAKTRKALSDWDAPYIRALMGLIETQSKQTLLRWALDYSQRVLLPIWDKHAPGDPRPQNALEAARRWLAGEIKLPQAKTDILACHAAARQAEGSPAAQAAARAVGQSVSTIHSARHSIGLAFYGSLAQAYDELGAQAPWVQLESRAAKACGEMLEALRAVSAANEPNPAKINWKC